MCSESCCFGRNIFWPMLVLIALQQSYRICSRLIRLASVTDYPLH